MEHSWTVEHQLAARGLALELRRYRWPAPHEMIHQMPEPVLGLTMERLPVAEMRPRGLSARTSFRKLGRLVFSPPGVPFDARGDGGETLIASFSILSELFGQLTRDFEWDERRLLACLDIYGTPIEGALRRLAREAAKPGFASDILLEATGAMIAVELARFLQTPSIGDSRAVRLFSAAELSLIADLIESDEGVSLDAIASRCGVGVRTLTRVFKATTGRTIGDVIAERRIERAMRMLRDHSAPLKVVAYRSGFASASSFVSAFRRASGMTPGAYRREWPRGRLAGCVMHRGL